MNGDIRHPSLAQYFQEQQLHELILSKFPTQSPPATFRRGTRSSKTPIDSAWATDDITIDAISWRDIPASPGDHRAIIVDINLVVCIGEPRYSIIRPPARRLNSALPFARDKYLHLLDDFFSEHHLPAKLDHLFALAHCPTTSPQLLQSSMEQFDRLKTEGMRHAEHHCRHLTQALFNSPPKSIYGVKDVTFGTLFSAGRPVSMSMPSF